ncbi:TIGR03571 family LLM class oxidoreductase [Bradyrhizobium jicamae]|uniref:TIGR03571 family LLM class oxidoreductase n=1 Tax=Bradyrhizobium jicamae TaxID=280332 RepID=A0ABS5FUB1_9BRAD|nr:TIGR03571 family LLM class oxidoreductase [Bradyrhizobium jicamae]MBR0800321.1 TIGR03571 family LLM class oxidoreductase [Bradyrhizobium jicamae]
MSNRSLSPLSLFRDGHLTLGVTLPIRETELSSVDFMQQVELATAAEQLGFSAVWVRDVPLNGPWYPETFGHPDPMVILGAIAARTSHIALGTAATVLTLRHPLHIAKAAISLDHLSHGRFVLGLGSGDRRQEFTAFEADSANRKELYRNHWSRLAAALEQPPRILLPLPDPAAAFELRPAAVTDIPMLAVGSGGQTLEWIARNAAGWATYHRPPQVQRDRYMLWRRAVDRASPGQFRSFTVALRVELLNDPRAPAGPIELGYRTGARQFLEILEAMRDDGVHHVMLTLLPSRIPPREKLAAVADLVLPGLK